MIDSIEWIKSRLPRHTFTIKDLVLATAYISLVIVGFQKHWFVEAPTFFFWSLSEGFLSTFIFPHFEHAILFAALLLLPLLIVDITRQIWSLAFTRQYKPLRKELAVDVIRILTIRFVSVVFLTVWLVSPFANRFDSALAGFDSTDQITRALSVFANAIPMFGLLFAVSPAFEIRRTCNSTSWPNTSSVVTGSVKSSMRYIGLSIAFTALAISIALGSMFLPTLVFIAIDGIQLGFIRIISFGGVRDMPIDILTTQQLRNLFPTSLIISACALAAIGLSFAYSRQRSCTSRIMAFTVWAGLSFVGYTMLYTTGSEFLISQQHRAYLFQDYLDGATIAVSLACLLLVLSMLTFRSGNKDWQSTEFRSSNFASLNCPVWLVLVLVVIIPVPPFDTTIILSLAIFLLSARSYRAQKIPSDTAVEISISRSSVFSLTSTWIILSISILLAVGGLAMLGASAVFQGDLFPVGLTHSISGKVDFLMSVFWWIIILAMASGVSYLYRHWKIEPIMKRMIGWARSNQ